MLLNNVGNIKKLICVVYKKNVPFLDRNKLYYMYLLTTTSVHGVDWPTCTCVLISQVCAFFVFLTNIKGLYKFTIFKHHNRFSCLNSCIEHCKTFTLVAYFIFIFNLGSLYRSKLKLS